MLPLVPLVEPAVAESVSVSGSPRVAVTVATPFVPPKETVLGDTDCPSLAVSVAVPVYRVAMLPYASQAVTLRGNPVPAVTVLDAPSVNETGAPP